MAKLTLQFGFQANAQSLDASIKKIRATGEGFARLIVRDVAIASSQYFYAEARKALVAQVKTVIQIEVSRMAANIARSITLTDRYKGPHGEMSLKEGLSQTALRAGFRADYNVRRQDTGIKWSPRTPGYLRRKKRAGKPGEWWNHDGDLKRQLGSVSKDYYEQAFGPIRVTFTKTAQIEKPDRVTPSGQSFRPLQYDVNVGRLNVQAFNKITPAMLPSLATGRWQDAAPTGNIDGITGLLPDDGPGGIRNKLLGRQAQRRYALEPFVSFYLTRAIPNAVWRRTERVISRA